MRISLIFLLITVVTVEAQQSQTPILPPPQTPQSGGVSTNDLQQKLNDLTTTVSNLQNQLAQRAPATDVDSLKAQMSDAQKQLQTVKAQLDSISAAQTKIASTQTADEQDIKKGITDVKSSIDQYLTSAQAAAAAKIDALASKYDQDNAAFDERPNQFEIRRSIMDPKEVSDIFGRRIGKRYIAYQVTVMNRRSDLQLRIQDLSLDFCTVFVDQARAVVQAYKDNQKKMDEATNDLQDILTQGYCVTSSQELTLLRGVAEKGQSLDPRNLTLHVLQAAGSVLGAVAPVSGTGAANGVVSTVFAKSVAVFTGPGLAAYASIFPDYSVTQTQRLSDSAYSANTIVPQGQSKILVVFLPQSVVFDQKERDGFWKDPTEYINGQGGCQAPPQKTSASPQTPAQLAQVLNTLPFCRPPLTKVQVHVKAQFIVDLADTPPALDNADPITLKPESDIFKAGQVVNGIVTGKYLGGATLSLVSANKGDFELVPGKIVDGEIDFTIKAKNDQKSSSLTLTFSVSKNKATVTKDVTITAPAK